MIFESTTDLVMAERGMNQIENQTTRLLSNNHLLCSMFNVQCRVSFLSVMADLGKYYRPLLRNHVALYTSHPRIVSLRSVCGVSITMLLVTCYHVLRRIESTQASQYSAGACLTNFQPPSIPTIHLVIITMLELRNSDNLLPHGVPRTGNTPEH